MITACIIDFSRCSVPLEETRLLGLTVGERASKMARRAGFVDVTVCSTLSTFAPPTTAASERIAIIPGDCFVTAERLSAAAAGASIPDCGLVIVEGNEIRDHLGQVVGDREAGAGWTRITNSAGLASAEGLLIADLTKPADGVISRRINRRISTAISRRLVDTPISPNAVSLAVLAIGLLAIPFAIAGTFQGFAIAGALVYIAAIIDGVDGELARLRHQGTKLGAWLDTIIDDVIALTFVGAVFLGLDSANLEGHWLALGGITLSLNLVALGPRYALLLASDSGSHQTLGDPEEPVGWLRTAYAAIRDVVFRSDFLFFFAFVCCSTGLASVFAVSYATGQLFAVAESARLVVKRRRRGSQAPVQIEISA